MQTKNEDWDREFVDAERDIPDVRVVLIGECRMADSCDTRVEGEVRHTRVIYRSSV